MAMKLLLQAFGNLLSNAVKYLPNGAKVRVRATSGAGAGAIYVDVEDAGIGIPERDKARIFTRYFRGRNVSGLVGSGVGLFLVATVMHLHGGEIAVQSSEGKGSRFTAIFPTGKVGHDGVGNPAREGAPGLLS